MGSGKPSSEQFLPSISVVSQGQQCLSPGKDRGLMRPSAHQLSAGHHLLLWRQQHLYLHAERPAWSSDHVSASSCALHEITAVVQQGRQTSSAVLHVEACFKQH